MAKRQSTNTPENVVRIDGEGKVHGNGGNITPACKLRGHGDHTWVTTDEPMDCKRCLDAEKRKSDARERLEYSTRVAESQEEGAQHVHPMEDARPVEPKNGTPVPRAEFTSEGVKVLPAVEPIQGANGETVTVPVDYDNPTAGRRELDASKGERVLSEGDMMEIIRSLRADAPKTAEAVMELRDKLISAAELMTTTAPAFTVELHEAKNGPALDVPIPPLPAGVHPHTWELAFQGNTEGARNYHMRQARAQEKAHTEHNEAMAESRKAVENDTPPF